MSTTKARRSTVIDLLERPPGKNAPGPRPYDPAQIYKYLWVNCDSHGRLMYHHDILAEKIEIERANLTRFINHFVEMGFIERKFDSHYLVRKPSSITWEPDAYDEFARLRSNLHKSYWDKDNKE